MTLGEYLADQARLPWIDGVHDCTTFAADWARTWGQGDPMAEWRGRYSTDAEADALVRVAGGLAPLFGRGLASIGAVETGAASEGDVGAILAVSAGGEVIPIGAVHTGRRWAFRTPAGLAFASAAVVKAWRRG